MHCEINVDLARSERPTIKVREYLWGKDPDCTLILSTVHEATVNISVSKEHIVEIVEQLTVRWPEVLAQHKKEEAEKEAKRAAEEAAKAVAAATVIEVPRDKVKMSEKLNIDHASMHDEVPF